MQVCGPLVNIGILTIRRPGRQLIQRETLTARKTPLPSPAPQTSGAAKR